MAQRIRYTIAIVIAAARLQFSRSCGSLLFFLFIRDVARCSDAWSNGGSGKTPDVTKFIAIGPKTWLLLHLISALLLLLAQYGRLSDLFAGQAIFLNAPICANIAKKLPLMRSGARNAFENNICVRLCGDATRFIRSLKEATELLMQCTPISIVLFSARLSI